MKRKSIFLFIAFLLVVIGVVMAQSGANSASMEQELTQVQQDLEEGRITQGQATQRMMEIMQRYTSGTGSTQPQQQTLQGNHQGWPAAQAFQSFQFTVLNQPAGTTASFNYTPVSSLEIFISGGNGTTVIQDLVRQVNSGTNSEMSLINDTYTLQINRSGVVRGNLRVAIEQRNSVIVFSLSVN